MEAWPAFPCSRAPASRSSPSRTMPSCSRRRPRSIPSATSPPRSERRSGTRSRGHGSTDLVTRDGRVAIVVEPRSLPLPGAPTDPRQEAVAAVIGELERLGMPADKHTIVIAGGLERRAGRRELEAVLHPTPARDFRGSVVVHDATSPDLRPLELQGAAPVRIDSSLLEADLIVCVTAAETSERGGPCALLGACAAETIASVAPAPSLLAPSLSPTGVLAGKVAVALARRTAVLGVSIVLDHPRLLGRYRGYPSSPRALSALGRSPLRRLLNTLPGTLRDHALQRLARELTAVAVLAGPPAVSHAEALLRGISLAWHPARRPARHDRRAAAVEVAARAARAAEPDHGGGDGPRPRSAALARRPAARSGRDRRPPPRSATHVRPRPRDAVPESLPRAARRRHGGTARGGARGGRRRPAGARGVPPGPRASSATALRRLGVVRTRPRSRRPGARRGLSRRRWRRGRSGSSRPTTSPRRSRWPAVSPVAATGSGCCSRRRMRRWSSPDGRAARRVASTPRRDTSCEPARSPSARRRGLRARPGRSRARSRGSRCRAPSVRSAPRAARAFPAG